MNRIQVPIFELKDINVKYGDRTVLKISSFKFHRGTVYGVVGPIACGKSTFINLLAGRIDTAEGDVLYESNTFHRNWRGKIKLPDEIQYCGTEISASGETVKTFLESRFGDRIKQIKKQYYSNGQRSSEWDKSISMLSRGQMEKLSLLAVIESDPKVLLIDNYGSHLDYDTMRDLNKKLSHVARSRGVTVILASSRSKDLRGAVSVQVSLDNGHLSQVRSFKRQEKTRSKR
ncbi:MAG: ABC transporter ATP-binding protein [Candidatus Neomarinimicrobiota bacterium]|nr:ABC transporter ATP-binding protein [Candidatus Neomarinimicrobiota bacterium]